MFLLFCSYFCLTASSHIYAFSCSPSKPIMERVDSAAYVFYGEILAVDYLGTACDVYGVGNEGELRLAQIGAPSPGCKLKNVNYTIRNIGDIKGDVGEVVKLTGIVGSTMFGGGYSCDSLQQGFVYRILTDGVGVSTCACSRDAEGVKDVNEALTHLERFDKNQNFSKIQGRIAKILIIVLLMYMIYIIIFEARKA